MNMTSSLGARTLWTLLVTGIVTCTPFLAACNDAPPKPLAIDAATPVTSDGGGDQGDHDAAVSDGEVASPDDAKVPDQHDAGKGDPDRDAGNHHDAGGGDHDAGDHDAGDNHDAGNGTHGKCGDGTVDSDEVCDPKHDLCCKDDCSGPIAKGKVCREADGVCDAAEVCDGVDVQCVADDVAPHAKVCRPVAGSCDVAEQCDGTHKICPNDGFVDASEVCRPSAGVCDVAEQCTGANATCPSDLFVAINTQCRAAGNGPCDAADSCTGISAACPDSFQPSGVVCRPAADECDAPETCVGTSAGCPAEDLKAVGKVCGSKTDCTVARCNNKGACKTAGNRDDGSPCDDGELCVAGDACQAGVCRPGQRAVASLFSDDFSTNKGWTTSNDWSIGPAQASMNCHSSDGFSEDPSSDHSPSADNRLAGVNIGGCTDISQHGDYCMLSPVLDLSGQTADTQFDFWRWLSSDYDDGAGDVYMQSHVDAWDGTTWQTLYSNGNQPVVDVSWTFQSFSLSSAFHSAQTRLRFCYYVAAANAYQTSGWNVDDVSVCGGPCVSGMIANDDGTCRWPSSCLELKQHEASLPSGVYAIDPDDFINDEPFNAYCDMTTDGGGYTLVFNDSGDNFDSDVDGDADQTGYGANGTSLAFSELPITADLMIDAKDGDMLAGDQDVRSILHGVQPKVVGHTLRDLLDRGPQRFAEAENNANFTSSFQHGTSCSTWRDYGASLCDTPVLTFYDRSGCNKSDFFALGQSQSFTTATANCTGWPDARDDKGTHAYPDNFRFWIR